MGMWTSAEFLTSSVNWPICTVDSTIQPLCLQRTWRARANRVRMWRSRQVCTPTAEPFYCCRFILTGTPATSDFETVIESLELCIYLRYIKFKFYLFLKRWCQFIFLKEFFFHAEEVIIHSPIGHFIRYTLLVPVWASFFLPGLDSTRCWNISEIWCLWRLFKYS